MELTFKHELFTFVVAKAIFINIMQYLDNKQFKSKTTVSKHMKWQTKVVYLFSTSDVSVISAAMGKFVTCSFIVIIEKTNYMSYGLLLNRYLTT